jgi:hypothetical protein
MILPYLELPVWVGYEGNDGKIVKGKFQPIKITSYHDGYNEAGMFIYHDGQPFQIALTYDVFEDQMKQYWAALTQKQTVKQKLGIIN